MPTILEVAQQYEQDSGFPITSYGLGRLGREMAGHFRDWCADKPQDIIEQAHFTRIEEKGQQKIVICYPEVLRPILYEGIKLFFERRVAAKENADREFQNSRRHREAIEQANKIEPVKRKRKRIPINQRYVFNLRNSEL